MADFSGLINSDKTFSDCRVKCGDRTWALHTNILVHRSDYFKAAFTCGLKDTKTKEVCIDAEDLNPDLLELALKFIYGDENSIIRYIDAREESEDRPFEIIPTVYEVADYLQINSLCQLCIAELKDRGTKRVEEWKDTYNLDDSLRSYDDPPVPGCRGAFLHGIFEDWGFTSGCKHAYRLPKLTPDANQPGIRAAFIHFLFEARRYWYDHTPCLEFAWSMQLGQFIEDVREVDQSGMTLDEVLDSWTTSSPPSE
ncbi:hypothetical protein B0T14DRAFT_525855 [Immersiella caudata]|uniref:BTB domain-containing protein n=1 Tax=Immersiella caudata TaxID=314043 RepID=A0AA39WD63_9PEZI|nr:hypothetical protein B0T14DRAFT_525855 [Immersiella caudata]